MQTKRPSHKSPLERHNTILQAARANLPMLKRNALALPFMFPPGMAGKNKELQLLDAALASLEELRSEIKARLDDAASRAFVAKHGIKRSEVQRSDILKVNAFAGVWVFMNWLRQTKCAKPWAEWHGVIHRTAVLKRVKFVPTPGLIRHVKP